MVPLTPLEPWIRIRIGSQTLSPAVIDAYQLQKLRETLALARQKSPFYRARLAGVPAELDSLAGLRRFPFTTPGDLRSSPLQFLCVSQDRIQRVVTLQSSGTSGAPKRIYFTQSDQELTIDFFQHGMATFTRPGDVVLICLPAERPGSVGDLLATALDRLGARPVRCGLILNPQEDIRRVQDLVSESPAGERFAAQSEFPGELIRPVDVLVGIPTQVLSLAHAWEQSAAAPVRGPRAVLLSTDHVPEAVKQRLEAAWGCAVFNHYGMTEMGLGGGVECQARRGYHLREADLYFEVIDPQSGAPLPEGEEGELVFTTLTRQGMPLIRYRTGDLGRFLPGPCACGTVLKSLEKVRCRVSGRIPLQGGTLTMPDLDEALFSIPDVLDFEAEVRRQNSRDILEISLLLGGDAGEEHRIAAEARLGRVESIARSRRAGALEVRVSARPPDEAGRVRPARRRITDLRGPDCSGSLNTG